MKEPKLNDALDLHSIIVMKLAMSSFLQNICQYWLPLFLHNYSGLKTIQYNNNRTQWYNNFKNLRCQLSIIFVLNIKICLFHLYQKIPPILSMYINCKMDQEDENKKNTLSNILIESFLKKVEEGPYNDLIQKIESSTFQETIRLPEEIAEIRNKINKEVLKFGQVNTAIGFFIAIKEIFKTNLLDDYYVAIKKYMKKLQSIFADLLAIDFHEDQFSQEFVKKEIILEAVKEGFFKTLNQNKKQLKSRGLYDRNFILYYSDRVLNFSYNPINFFVEPRAQGQFQQKKQKSWKLLRDFIEDKISQYQVQRIIFLQNYDGYYLQIKDSLITNAHSFFSVLKQQDFPDDFQIKFKKDTIKESIKISWLFSKNILQKDLTSKRNYQKLKYNFLKNCLNNPNPQGNICLFPGILLGRIAKQFSVIVYSSHSQKINQKEFLSILNSNQKLFQIIDKNWQEEENAYQTSNRYQVLQVKMIDKNTNLKKISFILRCFISLIKKYKIKALVLGDTTVKGSEKIFFPKHNRYYLRSRLDNNSYEGFERTIFDRLDRGGFPYFCPGGWLRLSLNVAQNEEQFDRKFGSWHVAYFGSGQRFDNIFSILIGGFRSATGCFSLNDTATYCTPSIQYAAMYSGPYFETALSKWVTIVIQLRVDPTKIIKKKGHTLKGVIKNNKGQEYKIFEGDKNFSGKYERDYEWLFKGKTKIRENQLKKQGIFKAGYYQNLFEEDGMAPYGIMIRLTNSKPKSRNSN